MSSFSSSAPTATAAPSFNFGGNTNTNTNNNAFSTASAAPSTTAFSFGTSAPAPAPTSVGGFGTNAPAPAFGATPSSTSTFGSGSSSAPVGGGGFGFSSLSTAPAPTGGTFGFGSNPSPSTGFGSAAPVGGAFGFGSAAPSTSFSFSGSSSNPASVSPFGTNPAFGHSMLGGQETSFQQQQIPVAISGNMQYNDLPPQMKQAFDAMHEAIMRHKRSMLNLQSMAPQKLLPSSTGVVDFMNRQSPYLNSILGEKLTRINNQLNQIHTDVVSLLSESQMQKESIENTVIQSIMYAKWPVEALAHRRGIRITNSPSLIEEEKKEDNALLDVQGRVRDTLDRAMAAVDKIEKMPSPYLWQIIHDMEQRLHNVEEQSRRLSKDFEQILHMENHFQSRKNPLPLLTDIVESQHLALSRLKARMEQLHADMERVRYRYRYVERGENVIDKVKNDATLRQRKLDEEIRLQVIQAPTGLPSESNTTHAKVSANTPAPFSFTSSGTNPPTNFSLTTPAPPTPAPANTAGFAFSGSTATNTATAPFTPAPSLSFGQNVGTNTFSTAPSTGFQTAATPAPTAFASTATMPPSAKKKTARGLGSSSRRR